MKIHIYRTNAQPLTRWRLGPEIIDPPSSWFTNHPRSQHRCHSCGRRRYAENLQVFAYYDHCRVSCAPDCAPSRYEERRKRFRQWDRETRRKYPHLATL